jgi:hypothetical protein
MYQRRSLNLALWLVALCALCAYGQASAQNKWAGTVKVRVDSVLAADTHEGTDPRLQPAIIERLQAMFDFTTYHLVIREEHLTKCGRMTSFSLPGGRLLHVAPQSFAGGMIAMELVLFDGARPFMTTDLKLMNHGILIVGGPRYQQGMLLTIIATDTNDAPAEATHEASPPPPPPPSLGPAIPATAPNAPNLPH